MIMWARWALTSTSIGFMLFCVALDSCVLSCPGVPPLLFFHISLHGTSHTQVCLPLSSHSGAGFPVTLADLGSFYRRGQGDTEIFFSSKECKLFFFSSYSRIAECYFNNQPCWCSEGRVYGYSQDRALWGWKAKSQGWDLQNV